MNGRLEKIIQKAQEQGYINPTLEAHAVAILMNAIHDGLLLQKVVAPHSSKVMKEVFEVIRAIFLTGQSCYAEGKSGEG